MVYFLNDLTFCQCLKYSGSLHPNLFIYRHQAKIRIQSCRLFIIISCSDLRDIFNAFLTTPRDQTEFGMYFITFQPVNDLTPCLLQHS